MTHPARNLINLDRVGKSYGHHTVLADVSLGIAEGDRIGVVGTNGEGKSTLLRMMAGTEDPDSGSVTRSSDLTLAVLGQSDGLDDTATIRHELVGDRPDHEWAGDPRVRNILEGLLGGVTMSLFPDGPDTRIGPLSGGERRRIALAQMLLNHDELLLLDEPTNHLDIDAVAWLASHLAHRAGSMLVITHDRWFLDAVVTETWEVTGGGVHQYEGGYAAYVLARAERDRQEAASAQRRRQLLRKELAWLRRGPPARTSKPKFRIDAANELIADEPEPRNTVELVRFATARIGKKVINADGVGMRFGARDVLRDVTWRLGPGERIALMGTNGSGKTTLLRILTGDLTPTAGSVEHGETVRVGVLSQHTAEIPVHMRVRESLEEVRLTTKTSDGDRVTAGQLCERFGFRGSRAGTLVADLSGGERRRLQLMRLLMEEPNVLILDEPTNDLDIDTLTALEDLLDSWPGTLIVVSHDRYFLERTCDDTYMVTADGQFQHLPGGVDQYLEITAAAPTTDRAQRAASDDGGRDGGSKPGASVDAGSTLSGGERRTISKTVDRLERRIGKLDTREQELLADMATAATDHTLLADLEQQRAQLVAEREAAEAEWMELSARLEA